MTSFILFPDRWTEPVSVSNAGVLGVDVAGAVGVALSLQAAARTRPAPKSVGRNRERSMVRFSEKGFVMQASGLTPRFEDTGDPWTGCRFERSLTVFLG
jgi:hypothetical protein